ncbi:MAG: EF-hand domain-containing protein, partial [Emcibacteraceae bacterium]|nr:EF-hand domain-containing protein [Emcibacteraceae bacterium]
MKKSIYVVSGVIALTIAGVAVSQDRGQGRGMSEMDTDGNGTVEKSEFAAMFDKRFAETDSNGNGISLDEYEAKSDADRAKRAERRAEKKAEKEEKRAERSKERAEKDAERLKERFSRLDENGDGTVSAEEYKAAGEKMFDRMDRDGDGILNDRRGRKGQGN